MMSEKKRHVFNPERRVDTTLKHVEKRMLNPHVGLKALFPGIQNLLDEWKPGDLIGFLAYTSNGKSSVASYIAHQHAQLLRSRKELSNHVVVYMTWEQPIEQQTSIDFSRVSKISVADIMNGAITKHEFTELVRIGEQQKKLPLWLIGHSIEEDRTRPMLTMPECSAILQWMEDECGVTIALVVLDYLQRIQRTRTDMREGYMLICDQARTMAMKQPTILLSQAKREVFGRKFPMPGLDDAQETSNFEQSCTHMHSFWMPKQNKSKEVKVNGKVYLVEDHMIIMEVLKQTLGPAMFRVVYNLGFGGTYLREWGKEEPAETFEPMLLDM